MKKVLFLIDSLAVGGAEISVLEVVKNLRCHQPIVCVVYASKHVLTAEFENAGAKLYFFDISKRFGFGQAVEALRRVIDLEKPDLVHTTLFKSEIIGRLAISRYKIPLVGSLISDTYGRERYALVSKRERLKLNLYKILNRFTAHKVDLFISVSHAIVAPNCRYLAIPKEKVIVVPNGRDIERFDQAEVYPKIQIADVGHQSPTFIVSNSRVIRSKGVDEMFHAIKLLIEDFPSVYLIMVGDGFDFEYYKGLSAEMKIDQHVVFLGRRNDIPSLLKSCDIFWFASHYEGSPGVVIEGLLSGIPMIVSDIDPVLENVEHGKHALIFKRGDHLDLAAKTRSLLNNPEIGKSLVKEASATARKKFDIRKLVEQQEEVYAGLIRKHEGS